MERNTVTTIDKLQFGDRFYKANDNKKTVFEKVEHKTLQTNFQTYRFWAFNTTLPSRLQCPEALKRETSIVFLRSKIFYQ